MPRNAAHCSKHTEEVQYDLRQDHGGTASGHTREVAAWHLCRQLSFAVKRGVQYDLGVSGLYVATAFTRPHDRHLAPRWKADTDSYPRGSEREKPLRVPTRWTTLVHRRFVPTKAGFCDRPTRPKVAVDRESRGVSNPRSRQVGVYMERCRMAKKAKRTPGNLRVGKKNVPKAGRATSGYSPSRRHVAETDGPVVSRGR